MVVGDVGNLDDTHGACYGGVDHTCRIGKRDVTNAQYTEFLNAVATTNTHNPWFSDMGV